MGNVIGKQLGRDQRLSHARPSYGIEKASGVTKQHRTASNWLADTESERECPSHRHYLLGAIQSCS